MEKEESQNKEDQNLKDENPEPSIDKQAPEEKENQNNRWNFKSVRNELYKPVERENKIVKKQIKLGVTVSGY